MLHLLNKPVEPRIKRKNCFFFVYLRADSKARILLGICQIDLNKTELHIKLLAIVTISIIARSNDIFARIRCARL